MTVQEKVFCAKLVFQPQGRYNYCVSLPLHWSGASSRPRGSPSQLIVVQTNMTFLLCVGGHRYYFLWLCKPPDSSYKLLVICKGCYALFIHLGFILLKELIFTYFHFF